MALYHTHRPQDFSAIIGQEHIVETLKNQILNDKVAHAYLFTGPRGVGKTTTARVVAKAMNCPRKKDSPDPDNTTDCAIEINASRSIDVIEIDAASHTGIDNVRENIIDSARFKPTKSPYKIFIIDEVHMLSTQAFNALLKTLEEPPPYVIFILATTEMHKLPETIVSRCQTFHFKKVGYDALKKHLEGIAMIEQVSVETEVIDRIIRKSDGCVRDAVSILDQIMATGEKKITEKMAALVLPASHTEEALAFAECLIKKELQIGLDHIRIMDENGIHAEEFAADAIELLRILLLAKAQHGAKGVDANLSELAKKKMTELQEHPGSEDLIQLIDLLMKRRQEIKSSPIPSLPLEMAVIEWCGGNGSGDTTNMDEAKHPANLQVESGESVQTSSVSITMNQSTTETPASDAPLMPETPGKQKERKSLKEKVKEIVHKSDPLDERDVRKKWQTCIQRIESESPSLVFILKMADLLRVFENTIEIGVGYRFHRDKLMDKSVQKKIDAALSEALGAKVNLSVIVTERSADHALSSEEKKENQELHKLASAFGGKMAG